MTRPLPAVTAATEAFWRGGAHDELLIGRCRSCGHWIHPPAPTCPLCLSDDVGPSPVSGLATVVTFTMSYLQWCPGEAVPTAVAIVELAEQAGLRLTTNLVNVPHHEISIGMSVRVTFLEEGDVFLPLFEPVRD